MRFGILGETRALRDDGGTAAVGGPGRRALLAMLSLEAGRIVSTERLIDGLYGDEPPAGVGNALQSQVSRLRAALGVPIERHPGGYRLVVARDEVDVHRFERLAAEGREALAAGEPGRAAGLLRGALRLWRGSALADVGDAPFAPAQVARLEELRIAAVEDRIAAELALDARHHQELVAELRELVARYPLRERLRAQLMRALYSCGRQAEALRVYEDARRELAESLGADPGPELAEAHLEVLRGAPSPSRAAPPAAPGGTAGAAGAPDGRASGVSRETSSVEGPGGRPVLRHGLPAQLTSFIGREEELARIGARLRDARLVTLTGPGGAGKTRIAVEAAGRHTGEVCFVDLSGLTHGSEVPQAIAGALGLREAGLLPGTAGRETGGPDGSLPARLTAALTDRHLMLVLDNCEHLVDDVARIGAELLAACPLLRVLATSREALGVNGETLCPLEPLPLPAPGAPEEDVLGSPAVRLFLERAAAVSPSGRVPDAEAAARICRALDGVPLAIELAAARLRSLSAADIADRLGDVLAGPGDRFRLLSRGSRTAQPRQRTLRGVVDWSWELLPEDERTVLRRASVFAGGWTLPAAEAICAGPPAGAADGAAIDAEDVLDLLASLADKSLVMVDRPEGEGGGDGGVRYRLLQTIRAYAAERLAETGESEALRGAHAVYFLDLALTADPWLRRAEQLEWLRRLAADHDNLHAALRGSVAAGDTALALRLLAALCTYWMLRGMRYEGARAARQLLAATGPAAPPGLAEEYALCVITAASVSADQAELAVHLAAATDVVAGLGGMARRYPVLNLLWAPFAGVPDDETYARYADGAASLVEPWQRALVHIGSGFRAWMVGGDIAAAETEFERALAGFRALGDRWGTTMALTQLAWLSAARGDVVRAVGLIDEALGHAAGLGATESVAELLAERGRCGLRAGRYEEARADFTRALELARGCGAREMFAGAHLGLGECARLTGDLAEARRLSGLALSECLDGWYTGESARAEAHIALGRIAQEEGDTARARGHFREAAGVEHGARDLPLAAGLADAFAGLALAEGDPARAAELLGVGSALRGPEVPAGPDAARTEDAVRAALGDPAHDEAYARGAGLPTDRALRALTVLTGHP
ncbi:BTAD domain-containing putative transcriptional regulator [Actinacidiphila sp. bgisy160]|uniref:BTAD domain-containing putative transcriptional regulator n=1 Tax=Actinacidiphila sp. bgisy160 TaxID=3413796 RepID=UPI003D748F1E